jgi:hypothetical protein
MKRFIVSTLSLLFIAAAVFSMAQDVTPTAGASTGATIAPKGKNEIRRRFHLQAMRIVQGEKSGTLTKDQTGALKEKLKSIGDQAKAFFLQNGEKPLTDDQKAQINQLLNDNSKALYQAKHPGQEPPATSDDSTATN